MCLWLDFNTSSDLYPYADFIARVWLLKWNTRTSKCLVFPDVEQNKESISGLKWGALKLLSESSKFILPLFEQIMTPLFHSLVGLWYDTLYDEEAGNGWIRG